MEKQKEVVKELIKMKIALDNLSHAFSECEETFESDKFDCNDFILGNKESENEYPFQRSFEEMTEMVRNWVEGCKDRIDTKLRNPDSEETGYGNR